MGRLGKDFARAKGSPLNKQGKEAVLALAADKGNDRVALVWGTWIKTRNLDGLTCPFFKFDEEFEETEAVMENKPLTFRTRTTGARGELKPLARLKTPNVPALNGGPVSKRLISTSTLTTIHHRYFMENPKGKRLS